MTSPIAEIKLLYKKYERWTPILFFAAGFLFDAIMLQRIDDWKTILQQAIYLLLSLSFIGLDVVFEAQGREPEGFLKKIWKFKRPLTHFMLGTLLNGYTIFYFKSASIFTSFAFLGVLTGILAINEFWHFKTSQTAVHMALSSLCVLSYMIYLVPIAFGSIGPITFLGSLLASGLVLSVYSWILAKQLGQHKDLLRRQLLLPAVGVHLFFVFLYLVQAIPPVPLSATYMGIYHNVKKEQGKYALTYTRPIWKFWQKGDQSFEARANDKIYCFVSIFSPARFKETLNIKWFRKEKGWKQQDSVPFEISGGREEGYRGFSFKSSYQPGRYRVQVETNDNREIGRIYFTVVKDESTDPRNERVDIR